MGFTDWDDERLLAARESPGQAAEAFTVFYDRYERAIAAFHMRRCGSAEDAADLTAETFARALDGRRRFAADGKDAGVRWLFGIARLVGLEHLRRSGQQQSAMAKLQIERPAVSPAASESMAEFLEDSTVAQVVKDFLRANGRPCSDTSSTSGPTGSSPRSWECPSPSFANASAADWSQRAGR